MLSFQFLKWIIVALLSFSVVALRPQREQSLPTTTIGRLVKQWHSVLVASIVIGTSAAFAAEDNGKLYNLAPNEIAKIVASDIVDREALATADFTRKIYSEDCIFQDEIDKYPIDKYVTGTKALFNAGKSHVDLVGPVEATEKLVSFKFSETLAFNIPLFNPAVKLSGHVELSRGDNGLIVYSREFWDQSVPQVLSTVKFN